MTGGIRISCGVRATDLTTKQVHEFGSLLQAKQALNTLINKNVGHSLIKKYAENNREMYGYKWELLQPSVDMIDKETETAEDNNIFTFRGCVENIFNGEKVRITSDTPRRVSVIDVIRVVCHTEHPYKIWSRLVADNAEVLAKCPNHVFQGSGQRETPVTCADGLMLLINDLPGKRAKLFRRTAAKLLARFLAGDQTLHEDIDDNASRQLVLYPDDPLQLYNDLKYANPKSNKFIIKGKRMKDRSIWEFYNSNVIYLLEFIHNGKVYAKIGWSNDIKDRMESHIGTYVGCSLYSIYMVDNASKVEKEFKERCAIYNEKVVLGGKTRTELFTGLTIEEFDDILAQVYHDMQRQTRNETEIELARINLELERVKQATEIARLNQEQDIERMKQETEIARLNQELEMKRLDFEIAKLNRY
jgi:hypothetical protein